MDQSTPERKKAVSKMFELRQSAVLMLLAVAAQTSWPQSLSANATLLLFAPPADGHVLRDVWDKAKNTEPTLAAARANVEAAAQRLAQANAAFWPQINATFSTNGNRRNYVQGPNTEDATQTIEGYKSKTGQINLTLPLIKRTNNAAAHQAELALFQAERQYDAVEAELLSKLVGAWCDWLAAADAEVVAAAQELSAQAQYTAYQVGFKQGLYGVQQLEDTNTKWQQARAEKQASGFDTQTKLAALTQNLGTQYNLTAAVRFQLPASLPFTGALKLEALLATALENNAAIKAAQAAVEVAQKEVNKQQTGHEPSLDLVASRSLNRQNSAGTFPGQAGFQNLTSTIGLQLNVPIYAGGGVNAKVKEAMALLAKAQAELETARRTTALQTTRAWAGLEMSKVKWAANLQAGVSARANLQQAVLGKSTGLKTLADELLAKQSLEVAERDARRTYLDSASNLALLAAQGALQASRLSQETTIESKP